MECPFQVGDPVVCVEELNTIQMLIGNCRGPIADEIYHIRFVRPGDTPCEFCGKIHIYVLLEEIRMPDHGRGEIGFIHTMFRKLITPEEFMSKDVGVPVNSGEKVKEHV